MKNYTKYIKSNRVTQKATALKYNSQTDSAPVVKAKGMGVIADRIIEIAKENNVELIENRPLARELYNRLEVGDIIPDDLFRAVSFVYAELYKRENRFILLNIRQLTNN